MGDMPQAKPRAIEQAKGFNPFLQSSNQPLANGGLFVGNPVSYSERVFDERSRWNRERRQRQEQLPLDLTPRDVLSLESQKATNAPQISQTNLSNTKNASTQGLADLATKVGCGLGLQHVVFAKGKPPPFEHLSNLGSGAFSIVEEVKSIKTNGIFVRKSVNITGSRANWLLPVIKHEVDVLKRLSHSHIITIQGTYQSPRSFCIIMSPVGDEDLSILMEEISEHGFLLDQRIMIWEWMPCLVSALSYIHSQGVRHRDIKPANIIHKGSQVFMTDFGSCREFDINDTSSTNTAAWGNTRSYSAPEVLDDDAKRGRPADIFSLGCVFLEIYSVARQRSVVDFQRFRERMGQGNSMFGVVSQDALLEWTSGISSCDIPNLNGEDALLRKMLLHDPDERPSAEDVELNLKAKPCKHNNARAHSTVYWPTALGDSAGGEEKVVY
jgi:serine/threonine protein kinase